MKDENGIHVPVLYYGYSNAGTTNVTIPVSMNNFFQGPPETGVDPITTFLPGFHGFAQLLAVGPDMSGNNTVKISWVLNNLYATVDTSNATQECPSQLPLTLTISAPAATEVNQTALISALVEASSLTAAQISIQAGSTVTSTVVGLSAGGPTSQFEATNGIYSSFVNPNDASFRGALSIAFNSDVSNIVGGNTPQDAPGTSAPPPTTPIPVAPVFAPTPVAATILPVAHCWEFVSDADPLHSFFYFGYQSSFSTFQTIEVGPKNHFVGAPTTDDPFPYFYPGLNGFVTRLRVPTGSLIQWNLAGYGVLLDGADVNFACQDITNTAGLVSVAAWGQGSVSDSAAYDGTLALSTVSRLPENNVQSSWTNVTTGGFRGLFNLTTGNNETVYTSMWRTVSDFHLSNGTLSTLWSGAFGVNADNYSCEGTPNDIIGQPLPPTDNMFIPISHCWMQGPSANVKYAYYGYLTNYDNVLERLPSSNNWISNAQGYQVPTNFYPGYNGFAASLTLRGDAATSAGTNVSWNLAGYTAGMDVTDTSKQCNPLRTITFTITYTGVSLQGLDQTAVLAATQTYLNSLIGVKTLTVQFDPTVDPAGGFLATVAATPDAAQGGSQYQGVTGFLQRCNSINSFSVRDKLSKIAGNATIVYCQGNGLVRDTNGVAGVTQEKKNYGVHDLQIAPNCYIPNDQGIVALFDYTLSNNNLYVVIPSTLTSTGTITGSAPSVLVPGSNPYSVRILSTGNSITWSAGPLIPSATVSTATTPQCNMTVAYAALSFERDLNAPPDMMPVLNRAATITGFPVSQISGSWDLINTENFVLTVVFNSSAPITTRDVAIDAASAASILVSQVTENATATNIISRAAGNLYLYAAATGSAVPTTPFGNPAAPNAPGVPSPVHKKGPSGVVVFGIIIGVLVGVGIVGAILFCICKRKGACRGDVETRPLLADD